MPDKDKVNLTQVIEDAAVKIAKETPIDQVQIVEDKPPGDPPSIEIPPKEDPKEIKQEPPKEEPKDEFGEEQLKAAKTLYSALNNPDPAIQKQAVKVLAAAAGLDLREIETPKAAVEAKDSMLDLLKNGLGEYDFLAEKLAPVLEAAINKVTESHIEKFRKETEIRDDINRSIERAFNKYENADLVKDDVVKLMDQFKPGNNISHEKYFSNLIAIAANEKNITLKVKGATPTKVDESPDKNKIERNRADAASRLASERGAEVKNSVKAPNQRRGINAAIEEAIEKLASEGARPDK